MGAYFLRRLIISIPVLFLVTIIAFFLLASVPGDPVRALIDPEQFARMTPADIEAKRKQLGLDGPPWVRYSRWLGLEPAFAIITGDPDPARGILQGEFGYSIKSGRSILADEIGPRLGPTLFLMGISLLIAVAIGVPFGVIAAVRQYSKLDYALTSFSFIMISTPTFVLGLAMIYIFAVWLRLLPSGGLHTLGEDSVGDLVAHVIMPATILGFANAAQLLRYTRSGMLEVLSSEYMVTAKSKGLISRIILLRHGLKNALIPIITVMALILPELVAGAIVTEQVFAWPGVGFLAVRAAADRDPSLMMGIVLMVAVAVMLSNLIADFAYAVVDPRVRYEQAR